MEKSVHYICENTLKECHVRDSDKRSQICRAITSNANIMRVLFHKYCDMNTECHKGQYVDRYANLMIKWTYYISKFKIDDDHSSQEKEFLQAALGSDCDYDAKDINCTL